MGSAPHRCVVLAALALGLCSGAGCGDAGAPPQTDATAARDAQAPARFLSARDLDRELSNGVRHGLYRLAVMSQPPDDAADLGQQLPTGTVDGVRCSAGGERPADAQPWGWRCDVRWSTVDGGARRTRYAVRLFPTGCFAAGATPTYPPHRDATIASFSEHPLNAIVSARKGC